ncbi:MAG: hypothetical protein AAF840_03810, partial [Bacteroidota bacterium]
ENLTIYELGHLFAAMDQYTSSKKAADLNYVLALIYRRHKPKNKENRAADYHGDIRRPLYKEEIRARQRKAYFNKVPNLPKQLLWFWLVSCRYAIVKNPVYSILFERQIGEPESGPDPYGWAGTLLHLAGDSITNLDKVAEQNYQNAFLQLAREKERNLEQLRRARHKV